VSIDGVEVASGISLLKASSDITQYAFTSYRYDKGTYHVDDLRIYGPDTETDPDPDILISAISVSGDNEASYIKSIGDTLQMIASVEPIDAADPSITWTVVDENGEETDAATIDGDGLVTAQQDGIVKIIATANDGSGVTGESLVTIDTTPPVIETPEHLTFLQTESVLVEIIATDNVSGLQSLEVIFNGIRAIQRKF
jgi:hypothetical protein